MKKPLYFLSITLLTITLSGCSWTYRTDPEGIVEYAKKTVKETNYNVNLLWYIGSKDDHDYFSYVYTKLGYRSFKVASGRIDLPVKPFEIGSRESVRINRIGDYKFESVHDYPNINVELYDGYNEER